MIITCIGIINQAGTYIVILKLFYFLMLNIESFAKCSIISSEIILFVISISVLKIT